MTQEDQIQHGTVVHVGRSPVRQPNSIKKTSEFDYIDLAPGGVLGDYHFQYELNYDQTKRLHLQQYPELESKVREHGGTVIQTHQVSLFEIEEIDRLHAWAPSLRVAPGKFGENITTSGVRLNEIRYDSIIDIGNVKLKVKARRSYCLRLFADCNRAPLSFVRQNVNELGEIRIGILCQVLNSGRIHIGDSITVTPNPDLINQPWINLVESGKGKPTLDRVEYVV